MVIFYCSDEIEEKIYDIEGNEIERTKEEYPYSYSPITIWIDNKVEANATIYSDRLHRMDYKKYNRLCKEIWGDESQYFDDRQPKDIEKFLSMFFNREIKLVRIREECNQSSGYPYWRFDYKDI
ncbi:MAG: hypothetical protein ACLTDM_21035 [Clostridium butyricum]